MNGSFWAKRALLARSVDVELRTQYAGTVLGLIWVVLGPLLLLVLYALIYTVIFNVRVPNFTRFEYILNVFSGLVLFLAFSQAMVASSNSMVKERKLLFSSFPAEFIPTKAVIVSYVILIPATLFVVLGDVTFSQPSWTLLLVPVVALMQLMFSIGLGLMLALLSLVIRDINFLIQYVVIALLIVTPIAYTPDMIPERLAPLLYINPLFYFVSANQHLILMNTLPPPDIMILGALNTVVFFVGGFWIFRRARAALVDLL
jgi:lipopolysaccharide transport system permease protein